MVQGQSPDDASNNSTVGGHDHTGIQGDRHGIAAEDVEKIKHGVGENGHNA